MKKIYTFFMAYCIVLSANAQLVFNENFSGFINGDLGTQGSWIPGVGGGGTDVQVDTVLPLIYPGYTSGTKYVTVAAANGTDPHKLFSSPITTGSDTTIFLSFVVRVTTAEPANSSPNYSIALINTADASRPLTFIVAEEPDTPGEIQFGISTGGSPTIAFTPVTSGFVYGTTYLIVIRYDIFSAAGDNDDAYLWVNPDLTTEPLITTANATLLNQTETDFGAVLNALEISQSSTADSPDGAFDAFRVAGGANSAQAWTSLAPQGAPLPVQLTSFNADRNSLNNIQLVWNVALESGILNYVVEKSIDGRTFNAIGMVPAAGQKTYSFTDLQSASDYTYYRLKMVETDGSYKLSHIISFKSLLSLTIILSPNPVNNRLLIKHPKINLEGSIQILHMNGQLVKNHRLPAGAVITNIDMSDLPNGLYHLVFRNGKDQLTKMVFKN